MPKKFLFRYSLQIALDEDALWPDGDAPQNPTVADVEELIEDCGGALEIIEDWNLQDNLTLDITEVK